MWVLVWFCVSVEFYVRIVERCLYLVGFGVIYIMMWVCGCGNDTYGLGSVVAFDLGGWLALSVLVFVAVGLNAGIRWWVWGWFLLFWLILITVYGL